MRSWIYRRSDEHAGNGGTCGFEYRARHRSYLSTRFHLDGPHGNNHDVHDHSSFGVDIPVESRDTKEW